MNNIGQSTLPAAPIAAPAPVPNAPESEAPGGSGSFDSLLQQRTDEPADSPAANEQSAPVDEPVKPAAEMDALDAAAQAGLIVMLFASPTILPLAVPVPTLQPDEACTNPVADNGSLESNASLPEAPTTTLTRPADNNTSSPIPTTSRQSPPLTAPVVAAQLAPPLSKPLPQPVREAATPQQEAKPLPEKEAAPALNVANVLGIIPPMQTAPVMAVPPAVQAVPAVSIDPSVRNTPTVGTRPAVTNIGIPLRTPAAASERTVTVTLAIPSSDTQILSEPTGHEPAIVAVSAPDIAPATFAAPATQPIPAEIAVPAPRALETLSQPVAAAVSGMIATVSKPIEITGMMAAKPGDAMPAPTLQRSQRPAPVTSAEPVSTEVEPAVASMAGTQTLRPAPVPAAQNGREHSADDHAENTERQPTPDLASTSFPGETKPVITNSEVIAPIRPVEVAQVVTQTIHAVEHMRATGQERVEVSVKLDGGHELIIQLRMANGEVTPVIRTQSEPLRLALEQNWSFFSQRGGESDLRITTPVFESPQTSSNMSDLNQQRDGRQRAFREPAHEFLQFQQARRNAPLNAPHPAAAASTSTLGVRLYA